VRPTDATITRDVYWFYRAHLKDPRDSIRTLAREYHANTRSGTVDTDHRDTIRKGIKRARHLLGEVPMFEYPPLEKLLDA
jgi:hypothetical protein